MLVIVLFPLYWTFNYSFLPEKDTVSYPPIFFPSYPEHFTLEHYLVAVTKYPILGALFNSIIIVSIASVVTLILSLPPAYVLAKLDFKLKEEIYYFIMALLTVPWVSYTIPLYEISRALGLIDTHILLIMLYGFSGIPLFTWLAFPFIKSFPEDLIDVSRTFGLSEVRILFLVVLPILRNALISLFILRFVWAYSDLLYQLIFTIDKAKMINPAVLEFPGLYEMPYARMASGGILTVLPLLILSLIFHKYIISGLTEGMRITA
jgi:multiple sugar transport system permease protein